MSTPTIPAGNLYMNATIYSGNSSSLTVTNGATGASFQPDFVWIKDRTTPADHVLFDSVRGVTSGYYSKLETNATQAETYYAPGYYGAITSLNSNGFTVASANSNWLQTNASGDNYVAWQWKAGGTAVSNTSGTITSQVSANTTSGFSVATFTCPASGNFTVGHGLGVNPAMIIVKDRSNANGWPVWHQSAGTPTQNYLALNTTSAVITGNTSIWANTAPTSSVVSFGTNICFNPSANAVMYAWSPIAGYSAFGSYTGNGSANGPFVYTGFRPRWIMIKRTDSTSSWYVIDTSINPYNEEKTTLYPNLSNAEGTNANFLDGLSNGFKMREAGLAVNGGTYIYAAFAENPFKYANAR